MGNHFAELTFTPSVQAEQERRGSRAHYARLDARDGASNLLGPAEADYLAQADSFYLATVGETGWPYVQHRGGPRGFVRVLSPERLAFADFRGNLQYISAGNAASDGRVSIIVMDYAQRRRLKLLGTLRFVDVADADPTLLRQVELPGYRARVERVAVIDIVAFNWNCPQHITQRFTLDQVEEMEAVAAPLRKRIAELEAQLSAV